MSQQFFFCKTELPPEAANAGAKILWRPSFVFFQSDWDMKGYAIFTNRESAEWYRMKLEEQSQLPITSERLDDLPLYLAAVVDHTRSADVAMHDKPIYIDPTDIICKSVRPTFKNFERFLMKHFQDQIPWGCDVVEFRSYRGFTIMVLVDPLTNKFTAVCMKGEFSDRPSISIAISDALGTTDEVYSGRAENLKTAEATVAKIKEHVDRVAIDGR